MSLQERYRFGPFKLDPNERAFLRGDESIPLPGKAFDLLKLLARNPGRTIPKAELMTALWPETAVEEANLTQTVFLLRKALRDDPEHPIYIQTVPRLGYKFVVPVTSPDSAIGNGMDRRKKGMKRVLGFAAVAGITFAAAMLLGTSQAPRAKAPVITPFSVEGGRNVSPVWSPDGKGIAFGIQRNETDPPQVHVKYFDSSAAMQLTHDQYGGTPIAWTPGRIVFKSSRTPAGLWTISPMGGEAEPLLAMSDDKSANSSHVSSDGSVVAYYAAGADGVYGVMISSPAGSPAKPYAPAPFAIQTRLNGPKVKFSPDGKQILLLQTGGAGAETWLMPYPADRSHPPRRILRNLPHTPGTPTAAWMPDNRRIVLGGMASGSEPSDLYMADTESGEYSVLSSGTTRKVLPAVSPDGRKLIFQDVTSDQDLVSIDLASAVVRPVLTTNGSEDMPAWAAKTAAMVYVTNRTGQQEIWLHRPGDEPRPVVTRRDFPPGGFISPVLSPDGTRLAYARSDRSGPTRMWMSAVAGGAPVPLFKDEAIQIPGSWSPDGEWIAFLRFLNGKAQLYKVKTTGEARPELLKTDLKRSGSGSVPAWSPTGEWILTEDDGMKLISPDGKAERDLNLGNVLVCGFSRDGALLYCMRQERTSGPGVYFSVPVAGGPERVIGPVAPENKPQFGALGLRLSLTPDGKSFTYSIHKTTANLWMMDGIE